MTLASQTHLYALALGSNRPLARRLGPVAVVKAAVSLLELMDAQLLALSPVITSRPIGPSRRSYANAACIVETPLPPPAMLAMIHAVEAKLGRRRALRWGERTIDIDIILWSGGAWSDATLAIPHVAYTQRGFVLGPLAAIAPDWRDPLTGHTIRQSFARYRRPVVDRSGPAI